MIQTKVLACLFHNSEKVQPRRNKRLIKCGLKIEGEIQKLNNLQGVFLNNEVASHFWYNVYSKQCFVVSCKVMKQILPFRSPVAAFRYTLIHKLIVYIYSIV